jgi:hypothetical protein
MVGFCVSRHRRRRQRNRGHGRERTNAELRIELRGVIDRAVLRDEADRLDRLQILGRIAGHEEEIRELAFLDRSQPLILA